ncbi:nuclear transport factor 2 family protein [Pseudomaricurvus alkylphenolicus]|uniref:nuclear transport factor 2 family protein n=1 Tax=Pseudomaricurvus alkylphenolicus TaxID=1306991 RepID=UPI001423525C|nr:nuclear transport factor 2 family protein [Pseudomaricurvus alkylphenolicus]NIB42672.1 nuclear transport factor 2 family protein [Pseudomaricurvus alkylphenolicus]
MTIEERLHQLESIEAIKQLKARYLSACDRKQTDIMRDCFVETEAHIDYGNVGQFNHRDGLIDVFNELGNHEYIIDMHHGQNPQIQIIDSNTATGNWQLYFQQINKKENTLTQLGGFYDDIYTYTQEGWRIKSTRFTVTSQLTTALPAKGTD